jgi:phosphoribosylaminoimidazole-succinocarboxamide synthase
MLILPCPPLAEGKTKKILKSDEPSMCVIESTNRITAFDDPSWTREFKTKARSANLTTCSTFGLLRDAGLTQVAYDRPLTDTTLAAPLCEMIQLECVARRKFTGGYCDRTPGVQRGTQTDRLVMEFFLKTTKGCMKRRGETINLNLPLRSNGLPIDDPLIVNPYDRVWKLQHPKKPASDPESAIATEVNMVDVLPDGFDMLELERLTRQTFLTIEHGWYRLGYTLWDLKIEFGIDHWRKLRIADVIDNDSWRLRDISGREVSKEAYRLGMGIELVEELYAVVAQMAQRMWYPNAKEFLAERYAAEQALAG